MQGKLILTKWWNCVTNLFFIVNSGSSSGSSSIPHSFSVDEIQKGRSLLRSSKSYPDDFLKKQAAALEDGDNSSSGVSSDQEIPPPNLHEYSAERESSTSLNKSNRQQIGTFSWDFK